MSSTIAKIKGVALTCRDQQLSAVDPLSSCPTDRIRAWDTMDYSPLGEQSASFFITTNSVEVPHQRQCDTAWPEDANASTTATSKVWFCLNNSDCAKPGVVFQSSRNGAVAPFCNVTTALCDIYGWGPVELKVMSACMLPCVPNS